MGKKKFQGKRGNQRGRSGGRTGGGAWTDIVKENAQWEVYYKEQGLIPEDEFASFKKHCQSTLPLTFRITGSNRHAIDVRESMKTDYIPNLQDIVWEGENIQAPEPIAFYPDDLAWTVKVGKQVIRKNQPFARFQRFLVVETAVGNISRQEAVSMIPPLLLDVESHHTVFDMCAAPGSKTAQLVESLHKDTKKPTGFVVANDSDYKRSHMLIHQVKRLNTPNFIVTNHDAAMYPRIQTNCYGKPEYLKFDRVLCDVPCSGDATMRKNINVWKDWTVGNGNGLHSTQVNILLRGLQLLKPGGRLVYSTCSLNPVENEAVIAEALRTNPNTVSLVDVSDRLPGLKRRPGVSSWKTQAKNKEWRTKDQEGNKDIGLSDSMFQPTEAEAEKFHLDRSIRVYPHQQDTGGFFIAVFEKRDPPSAAATESSTPAATPAPAPAAAPAPKREAQSPPGQKEERPDLKRYKSVDYSLNPEAEDVAEAVDGALSNNTVSEYEPKPEKMPRDANEEPFKFLNPKHKVLNTIWKFYNIDEKFPKQALLVRNTTGEPVRTIYYLAPELREIILANEQRLKFVHAGIKMFTQQKNEGECKWRVQNEGLDILFPAIGDSRVCTAKGMDTLNVLCEAVFPRFSDIEKVDPEMAKQIEELGEGCAFIKVPYGNGGDDDLVYPLWRGRGSVNIMLPKEFIQELLHRLFKVENVKKEAAAAAPSGDASASATDTANATEVEEQEQEQEQEQ